MGCCLIKRLILLLRKRVPSPLYTSMSKEGLVCRQEKIKQSASPTNKEELKDLEHDYEKLSLLNLENRTTANIII